MKHLAAKEIRARTANADPGSYLGGGISIPQQGRVSNVKAALLAAGYSDVRTLEDREFGYVFGNPTIIVGQRNGSAFVVLRCVTNERRYDGNVPVFERRPFGWPSIDMEFLNPASPAVDRYAREKFAEVKAKNRAEYDRRERLKIARLRDRKVNA